MILHAHTLCVTRLECLCYRQCVKVPHYFKWSHIEDLCFGIWSHRILIYVYLHRQPSSKWIFHTTNNTQASHFHRLLHRSKCSNVIVIMGLKHHCNLRMHCRPIVCATHIISGEAQKESDTNVNKMRHDWSQWQQKCLFYSNIWQCLRLCGAGTRSLCVVKKCAQACQLSPLLSLSAHLFYNSTTYAE